MDLEEWEYLPDDGFLDFSEDGVRKIYVRDSDYSSRAVFDMNYFICPDPENWVEPPPPPLPLSPRLPKQLRPLPIRLDPPPIADREEEVVKLVARAPLQIEPPPPPPPPPSVIGATGGAEADQDLVSQVFFKKMKDNEFVDMKMDSPKSGSKGFLPQIEAGGFPYEETPENNSHPAKKNLLGPEAGDGDGGNGGFNVWKWGLTGIGALCSFGVAATTICIIILAGGQKNKRHQHNQKLRFQIIADDKRIKRVVEHATKLNEAISAVSRGVPLPRAHITVGGYYDGL